MSRLTDIHVNREDRNMGRSMRELARVETVKLTR